MPMQYPLQDAQPAELTRKIKAWARSLGLSAIGITDTDLRIAEARLETWLDKGHHGEMAYMAKHGTKRSRPTTLKPGTMRIISARLDYLPEAVTQSAQILADPQRAFIARYTLGRDYHKVLRKRLQRLVELIRGEVDDAACRVFVDSAPVMEKPLAQKAGLGWIGKHTNLLARDGGSWFFLGEIYTNLPLICDLPAADHCGDCTACIRCCPTQAIIAPYQLDARRCISYLTIELRGAIPEAFRRDMGNRIFGCDDCIQVCPWNRFAKLTRELDFLPRASLDSANLIALFNWDETTFLKRTEGSAIRRLGHERWLRNIAVALGNAPGSREIISALQERLNHKSPLVREHVGWALLQHGVSDPASQ
ncbi:MAG: tRNA epoxyqueuosine(34) reductase QueG [gamma proteobacterium symbiont of Ctena orbiculata]|nr:MAG: tRNA epoxyqueuosine(34) reductase QueG [gamma proteobacterium symbiont of Ctena orbiculata]PVV10860.1 MAG: tRNA epoxyqueuosine(34) reductase QueG [gamma proteobacterium symbiont of Ctena orbiculata]PVV13267.1 MAG: tRNA epoxyqueuosine(34) reductase QueG [gamma proteobacterium symbiont of Ctena orbiculata]PVV21166.1 MAG: tRNA epoxyqueuosine(34) reductase QueG [gamma proteobacterium symbiont of Ctena orbiculata]